VVDVDVADVDVEGALEEVVDGRCVTVGPV
jgi:hypothetical protein